MGRETEQNQFHQRELPISFPTAGTIMEASTPEETASIEFAQVVESTKQDLSNELARLSSINKQWDPGLESIRFIPGQPKATPPDVKM